MASSPILDIDSLLAPIPGDNPAGESMSFALRQQLDEDRKEVNPDSFPPDYPGRPELKKADWPGIIGKCRDALQNSSKDLLLVARLTEALTKEHGFGGLRDGLLLFTRLVEECWDRVNPVIEEGDVEVRATAFNWLDDPTRGGRFPSSVRTVPMFKGDGRDISYLDWEKAKDGKGDVTPEMFDKAVQATSRESCQTLFDDIEESGQFLKRLSEQLTERMGSQAPPLLELRGAIDNNRTLAQQVLQKKGPMPRAAAEREPTPSANAPETAMAVEAPAVVRAPRTRGEVYAQISTAADMLEKMEPHSPIPILLRRVVELGSLSFPELMAALVRDQLMTTLLRNPELLGQVSGAVSPG